MQYLILFNSIWHLLQNIDFNKVFHLPHQNIEISGLQILLFLLLFYNISLIILVNITFR